MNERIADVIGELKDVSSDVRESFGPLSDDQLNWKPSAESWSVAQCLDHLIKTNEQFYPEFERLASGGRSNTFWQSYSPFTGIGGRFLISMLKNDARKSKAPSKDIVPPSDIPDGILERFSGSLEEVCMRIEECSSADLKKTVVSSPFLSAMTYTLDDAYSVLVEHSKRHVRQAKRVVGAEGFPSSTGQHVAV